MPERAVGRLSTTPPFGRVLKKLGRGTSSAWAIVSSTRTVRLRFARCAGSVLAVAPRGSRAVHPSPVSDQPPTGDRSMTENDNIRRATITRLNDQVRAVRGRFAIGGQPGTTQSAFRE